MFRGYLRGMHDRSMRSGTELAREIQITDWSTAGNLSNRSCGVQIPRDICTRFGRYLYSAKCNWIITRLSNASSFKIYARSFAWAVFLVLTIYFSLLQEEKTRLLEKYHTKQKEVCFVAFFLF